LPSVLIDPASGSKELLKYPPLNNPEFAEPCSLAFSRETGGDADSPAETSSAADVCILGCGPGNSSRMIGIEVKSIAELCQALDTGRLQHSQLPTMRGVYDVCYLVYYGVYRRGEKRPIRFATSTMFQRPGKGTGTEGMDDSLEVYVESKKTPGRWYWRELTLGPSRVVRWSYLERAKHSIRELGIRIEHLPDLASVAYWIGELAVWAGKPYEEHGLFRGFDKSDELPVRLGVDRHTQYLAEIAHRLPGGRGGMGYARSMAAAMRFGSVEAMVNASAEEWASVEVPDVKGGRRRKLGAIGASIYAKLREKR